ncbi:MAG: DUF86 domain-containing protein [Prevotella sp.]|nr:DUF86 domain-containing protein [Prevotella sp.]
MREYVRDLDRLEHIVEAIDNILNNPCAKTKEDLEADKLRYYGIVKNIEIIGEAAYQLTKAFCKAHPETPWIQIAKTPAVIPQGFSFRGGTI